MALNVQNACFRYPTASQSITVKVGLVNYQNSALVGASKGHGSDCQIMDDISFLLEAVHDVIRVLDTQAAKHKKMAKVISSF